jgi:predicted TIM-barrel fold metal-dependent hydrolase
MDDEKVTYRGYEKMVKAGIKNVCVHKGLYTEATAKRFPKLEAYADVSDVAKAAKDWPQLNFIIYHSAFRNESTERSLAEFERTGRLEWVSDLADIPQRHGVNNVYGDLGQIFAATLVSQPRVCAAIMGTLIKGLGHDRVVWGTDALWTGSPQWQIEGLRRLEIPEDMQKKYGFKPLGDARGAVKTAIFGDNNARLYGINQKRAGLEAGFDWFASLKRDYEAAGPDPSNLRYGYINTARG